MLPLPNSPIHIIKLADWLEIKALISADENSSIGELEGALRIASPFSTGEISIEEVLTDVFNELKNRARDASAAYPFNISGSVIQKNLDWHEYPAYVFCLCLSYLGGRENKGSGIFPARYFEHISRDAAVEYLGGEGVRFASPRLSDELPVNFRKAIDKLCEKLNEGESCKTGKISGVKDDDVDIIVWKHFPDRYPGKIILFGNCATQTDWEDSKRTELDPDSFSKEWLINPLKVNPIRSFFIPHRVEYDRFCYHLRRAGIIFDRCRISYLLFSRGPISKQDKKHYLDYSLLTKWSQKKLKQLKAN